MSDRVTISAAFSVLMMSAFVLFGPNADRSEFAPGALRSAADLSMSLTQESPAAITGRGISLLAID